MVVVAVHMLYLTLQVILAGIIATLLPLSSYSYFSALAFHTASTANVTIQTGESGQDTSSSGEESSGFEGHDESLPLDMATEIESHIDGALRALSNDDVPEVNNQLMAAKEKLSLVMTENASGQQR